jgi:hypothetical protein
MDCISEDPRVRRMSEEDQLHFVDSKQINLDNNSAFSQVQSNKGPPLPVKIIDFEESLCESNAKIDFENSKDQSLRTYSRSSPINKKKQKSMSFMERVPMMKDRLS